MLRTHRNKRLIACSKLKHLYIIVVVGCCCFSIHPSLPFTGTAACCGRMFLSSCGRQTIPRHAAVCRTDVSIQRKPAGRLLAELRRRRRRRRTSTGHSVVVSSECRQPFRSFPFKESGLLGASRLPCCFDGDLASYRRLEARRSRRVVRTAVQKKKISHMQHLASLEKATTTLIFFYLTMNTQQVFRPPAFTCERVYSTAFKNTPVALRTVDTEDSNTLQLNEDNQQPSILVFLLSHPILLKRSITMISR